MTAMSLHDLSQQLNSQIIVCLKLYECIPVSGGLTVRHPDAVESYLDFGFKAGDFCRELLEEAEHDYEKNQQARERVRQMLISVLRSNLPKDHIKMACQGLVALFLWLVLHDPQEGQVLRINVLRAIQQFGLAVVTIGCSSKRAYVITVGDAATDVTDALLKAENTVGSRHETAVTLH